MSVLCVCSLNVDVSRGDMVSVLSADQQLYAEWIVLPDAITELFVQLFFSDRFGTFSASYPVTLCLA